jgi:hypothetical protein
MEPSRGDKSICLPFDSETHYDACVRSPRLFRQALLERYERHPELFPTRFGEGFTLDDRRYSVRQQLWLRRIELRATGQKFTVRPSLVFPYMLATTDEVEKGLYLRRWGVPYEALSHVFGHPPMLWYRAELALGRPSIVGTTVKAPERLPQHLVGDEKHTKMLGKKVYVPTVVGAGCILGADLTDSASQEALQKGYGQFAREAREVEPTYCPKTVCTDGWDATQNAFKALFKGICVILCFLHSVLKISDRCKRDPCTRTTLLDKAWAIYEAADRTEFSQRVRRFREWALAKLSEGGLRDSVLKLCSKRSEFLKAFDHPRAHRTSNAIDRLIDFLDRRLFVMRKLHGTPESARLAVRSMALQWNFHPYGSRLRCDQPRRRSPFHDLNGFEYHPNWLHNLLIAASMGGRRTTNPKLR